MQNISTSLWKPLEIKEGTEPSHSTHWGWGKQPSHKTMGCEGKPDSLGFAHFAHTHTENTSAFTTTEILQTLSRERGSRTSLRQQTVI